MGTPNYPRDLASEWNKLRRDVKNAFTSANLRTGMAKIGAKTIEITGQLVLNAGANLIAKYSNGNNALYVGKAGLDGNDYGLVAISRYDGTVAMQTFGREGDPGFFAIYDKAHNIIMSDDAATGEGLARPWLSYTFVETSKLTSPSTLVTSSSWTSVHTIQGIAQHPKIRVAGGFVTFGTDTGKFRVVDGSTVLYTSGTLGPGFSWQAVDMNHNDYSFSKAFTYDIQVMRASGTSSGVGFTPTYVMGRQT